MGSPEVIRDVVGGMVTLMFAKIMFNDVPHALELSHREAVTYQMQCPHCGYSYKVSLLRNQQKWEICPICGYGAPFSEFMLEVVG